MESKRIDHNTEAGINKRVIVVLLLSSICLFLGRSYQHMFFDIPIRIILWDQDLMEPFLLQMFDVHWEEFIRSAEWDSRIQSFIKAIVVVYLCCCALCIQLMFRRSARYTAVLLIGSGFLFSLALLYTLDKFGRVGELMEYTCQWFTPIALYLALKGNHLERMAWGMRIAITLTFTGHGLYAVGYYPIPGNFIDMMILGFGVSENVAIDLLAIAGWLDFIVAVLIWLPMVDRYVAFYAFLWGALTALARVWTNFDFEFAGDSISQWLYETLVRVPNALLPLAFILLVKRLDERLKLNFLKRLALPWRKIGV